MKIHFSIGKFSIHGVSLLRLLQEVLEQMNFNFRKPAIESLANYANDIVIDAQTIPMTINIKSARGWLICLGQLANGITKFDAQQYGRPWFPCNIVIGAETDAPKIKINDKGLVEFQNTVLSYEVITERLKRIKIGQNELIDIFLARIRGESYPAKLKKLDSLVELVDSLLVLMVGVESSRNNATLLTSLMLFDLIKSNQIFGRRNQHFTWSNAFVSEHSYKWDDFENKDYGGKFPMSQQSTGPGNLGKGKTGEEGVLKYGRANLLFESYPAAVYHFDTDKYYDGPLDSSAVMQIIDKYPQRHAVIRREISLIIHWLKSLHDTSPFNICQTSDDFENTIKALFKTRLEEGFGLTPTSHKDVWLDIPLNACLREKKTSIPSSWDHISFKLIHYSSKTDEKYNSLIQHRADVSCKLIPGYIAENEKKKDYLGIEMWGEIGSMQKGGILSPCDYCYSQPIENDALLQNRSLVLVDKKLEYHQSRNEIPQHTTIENPALMFASEAKKKNFQPCGNCWPYSNKVCEESVDLPDDLDFEESSENPSDVAKPR